ncbi:hypothetical protein L596_023958 [Steinernema carpocapsae]|uniref:Uncharacterized protein n=1 Tax=Steinernema carpocapsae TaxID=34508 RepID=A0A4U5MF85_STECR|nr:hypothetical protein L596_023958 [Steinernema carpocapsae]
MELEGVEPNEEKPSLQELTYFLSTLVAEKVDPHDEQNYQYIVRKNNELLAHRMSGALFSVLCDQKQRIANSRLNSVSLLESIENKEIARLDNMLVAEGIIPKADQEVVCPRGDAVEYKSKLDSIRNMYEHEMAEYEKNSENFKITVTQLLELHKKVRPITDMDSEKMMHLVDLKAVRIATHIKQWACENVMSLKGRLCDARRKRRNFTKTSTDILNQYFFANLENPYPSEEVKEELARMCNITTNQVSNWFGNKRIRYKKSIAKTKVQEPQNFALPPPPNPFNYFNPFYGQHP